MTPEQINIAIAEHLNAKATTTECPECYGSGRVGSDSDSWKCEMCVGGAVPPYYIGKNYSADLNAMHEAEKLAFPESKSNYRQKLLEVCKMDNYAPLCAPAAQRAEAFLRTVGKWQEDHTLTTANLTSRLQPDPDTARLDKLANYLSDINKNISGPFKGDDSWQLGYNAGPAYQIDAHAPTLREAIDQLP